MVQDNDTNMAISVTQGNTNISWDRALVSSGEVTYTVMLDGVEAVSNTTATSAVLTVEFDRTYNVTVEAFVCNKRSPSPLQGTVLVPAPGDR